MSGEEGCDGRQYRGKETLVALALAAKKAMAAFAAKIKKRASLGCAALRNQIRPLASGGEEGFGGLLAPRRSMKEPCSAALLPAINVETCLGRRGRLGRLAGAAKIKERASLGGVAVGYLNLSLAARKAVAAGWRRKNQGKGLAR